MTNEVKKGRGKEFLTTLRARYERATILVRADRKVVASYDELLELFKKAASQKEVADLLGISTEAVRVKYDRYFAPVLGPWRKRVALKRWKAAVRRQKLTRRLREATILEKLQPFVDYARLSGLPFRPLLVSTATRAPHLQGKVAQIGNVFCRLIHSKRLWRPRPNNRPSIRFGIQPKDSGLDGVMLIAATGEHRRRRFFFPMAVLNLPESGEKSFYIPLSQSLRRERRKGPYYYLYDFWFDYEEEKGIKKLVELSEKLALLRGASES